MRGLARFCGTLLLALAMQGPAHAWSGPGHAAIAAMAYRQLPAESRQRFTDILRNHPSFAFWKQDFDQGHFPAKLDLGMYLFIRASTWPDEIRHTTNPFNHPNWHFIDYPLQQTDFSTGPEPTPDDDILFGIKESQRVIQDASATPEARAAHLSWLIHLAGDIQQPLHCVSLSTTPLTCLPRETAAATSSSSVSPAKRPPAICTASGTARVFRSVP
jgi:hypothetical protein